MAAPPPHHSELGELARCLRQERLYVSVALLLANEPQFFLQFSISYCQIFQTPFQVSYEKKQLQQLNEQLATAGRRLAQSAWTTFQQRENLEVSFSWFLDGIIEGKPWLIGDDDNLPSQLGQWSSSKRILVSLNSFFSISLLDCHFFVQGLVMSRGDSSPQQCCQRANLLQQAHFTDAYKLLSHQMVSYSEFLAALRSSESLLTRLS